MNEKNEEINKKNETINNHSITIGELERKVSELETQLADARESNNGNADQIRHLEAELKRANEKVAAHNSSTENAVNEARNILNSGE